MKVLFLRPEGSEVESQEGMNVINIHIFKPQCLEYVLPKGEVEAVAFTSVNGVKCAKELPSFKTVYAVGPLTAKVVKEKLGLEAEVPETYTIAKLVEKILNDGVKEVLFFRSLLAGEDDLKALYESAKVYVLRNYTLVLDEEGLNEARRIINECGVDYVAITSPSIAKAIAPYLKDCVKVISIGPSTSRELSKYNIKFLEAKTHTVAGILDLIKGMRHEGGRG